MLEDVAALRAVGVKHCIIYSQRPTIGATLDLQQRLAEKAIHRAG